VLDALNELETHVVHDLVAPRGQVKLIELELAREQRVR
jgi:hypothetical protein